MTIEFKDLISLASLFIAITAFIFSFLSRKIIRRRERAALYLELKNRFLQVYKDLELIYKLTSLPDTPEERSKVLSYWHNAFDEWYATVELGEKLERKLWTEYFFVQVVLALKHPALRDAFELITKDDIELGTQVQQFRAEIERLWRASHKGPMPCEGIRCSNHNS